MGKIMGAITKINLIAAFLSGFFIFVISIIFGVEAFSRNLFGKPLEITSSIPQFLMIYCIFLGTGYCLQQGGHIRIEILLDHLNNHKRRIFDIIGYLLSAVFIIAMIWKGLQLTIRSYVSGWVTFTTIQVPIAYINVIIPVGSFLMLLALINILIQKFKTKGE